MAGYFELKSAADSKFRFNLRAGNHEVILTSQTYATKPSALGGIESVKLNSQTDGRFERKVSKANEPYFVLTATNGQVIGQSEMYSSTGAMENGIRSVMTNAPAAPVKETS